MPGTGRGGIAIAARVLGLTAGDYEARRAAGEKWCGGCKAWHAIEAFGLDISRGSGRQPICRTERQRRQKARYQPRPRARRVPARDGDKQQARMAVHYAVKYGRLPDPNGVPCADCGHLSDERRHEYDHHEGYAADKHLAVQAVCASCHARRGWARGEIRNRFVARRPGRPQEDIEP